MDSKLISFKDVFAEPEAEQQQEAPKTNEGVDALLTSYAAKGARFNVRINTELYNIFKEINHKRGVTNASVLNLLISDYVEKNKRFLD